MVDLGVLYYNGYGNFLKVNFEEAIKLWKAAEEMEHPIDIGAKSKVTQLYDNNPKLQSLVAQYQKEVAKASKEAMDRQMAQLEKQKKEEEAYNEMLYQQSLNRGRISVGSQWEGFTYDAATKNSYHRTSAEHKAKAETANYKRYLDYRFGQ